MKYFNIIILLSVLLIATTSCLDESPKYTLDGKTIFSSDVEAQMALNGCYGYMISYDLYGQQLFEVTEGASGIFWAQRNSGDSDNVVSLSFINNNGYFEAVWRGAYRAITNINGYLYGVENGQVSDAYKLRTTGEALFLRGLCYYILGSLYESAPIIIEATSSTNINNSASPSSKVLEQAILDFEKAANYLPERGVDPSKPSQFACFTMLAKLHYYNGNLAEAKIQALKVYNKYQLETNFSKLFTPTYTTNNEDIFVFNNSINLPSGMGNRLSWLFSPQLSTNGISWGRFAVSKAFFDYNVSKYEGDPRISTTYHTDSIYMIKDGKNEYTYCYPLGFSQCDIADRANPTKEELDKKVVGLINKAGKPDSFNVWERYTKAAAQHNGWPGLKKYFDPNQSAQLSHQHMRVIRYADVVLMLADIEVQQSGDMGAALGYVNQVIRRARESGTTGKPLDWTTADLTIKNLYYERLFEFVGEGFTFMETRRYGVDFFKNTIVKQHDEHHITIQHSSLEGSPFFYDRLYKNTVEEWNSVMKFPIPKKEVDVNPNL